METEDVKIVDGETPSETVKQEEPEQVSTEESVEVEVQSNPESETSAQ